jgi:hypothetical protein
MMAAWHISVACLYMPRVAFMHVQQQNKKNFGK